MYSYYPPYYYTSKTYPSQDSSVGSISAWYWGIPRFKSRQRREFYNENKKEYPQVKKDRCLKQYMKAALKVYKNFEGN